MIVDVVVGDLRKRFGFGADDFDEQKTKELWIEAEKEIAKLTKGFCGNRKELVEEIRKVFKKFGLKEYKL